ncbi:hypothetical protein B0H34DRAFT_670602 [Crassisporium funariophilum]|nr:hypothetical protein B0H34DRAFT_670602 [Crassisporium funariophilum]
MTGMDMPSGTIGNLVPVNLQNVDAIIVLDTGFDQTSNTSSDLPQISPDDHLDTEVERENIRVRNTERRVLRDAGVTDISDDKEVNAGANKGHHVQAAGPSIPDNHQTVFLAAWLLMSEDQKKNIFNVIVPKSSPDMLAIKPKVATEGPIFSEDNELPPVTVGAHRFGVHPEVKKLAVAGLHVPILLFLAKSMQDIFLKTIPKEQHIIGLI